MSRCMVYPRRDSFMVEGGLLGKKVPGGVARIEKRLGSTDLSDSDVLRLLVPLTC